MFLLYHTVFSFAIILQWFYITFLFYLYYIAILGTDFFPVPNMAPPIIKKEKKIAMFFTIFFFLRTQIYVFFVVYFIIFLPKFLPHKVHFQQQLLCIFLALQYLLYHQIQNIFQFVLLLLFAYLLILLFRLFLGT